MMNKEEFEQNFRQFMNPPEPDAEKTQGLASELICDLTRSTRLRAEICNIILDPEKLGLEALERVLCFLYGGELTDSDVRKELTNLIYDPAITEEELTRIRDFAWEVRIESGEE